LNSQAKFAKMSDKLFFLEKKKILQEQEAFEKKLNAEYECLKECDEFYKDFPIETAFALFSARASIEETKKVAEAWVKEEKYELKDPYYSCGWSPYNATDEEKDFLTPSLYKPLRRPSVAKNMRSVESMMKTWEYRFYNQGWQWCEDYAKLSQDEKEASKEAFKEAELKGLMAFFDEETASYPEDEAAHFAASLKKEEERRKSALCKMARDLRRDEKTHASKIAVPVTVFEELCKRFSPEAKPSV